MVNVHCYTCGGFISDPSMISHRLPASIMNKGFGALPTSALCTCTPPVVYGSLAGRGRLSSSPDQRRLN